MYRFRLVHKRIHIQAYKNIDTRDVGAQNQVTINAKPMALYSNKCFYPFRTNGLQPTLCVDHNITY